MLTRLLNALHNFFFNADRSLDEAFLADAADLYDLERRQRLLEQGHRPVFGF